METDVCVVGGGPAGLSAALWLGRYRRSVALVDTGQTRNRWADRAHGYLGHDPTPPVAFVQRGREEVLRYDSVRYMPSEALTAERDGDGFAVTTTEGQVRARRLVIATGVVDTFPEIRGFAEHYGADVQHCPSCDGYESRGCRVVAYGWSSEVAGFAASLLDWAADVTVITDGRRYEGDDRHRAALAARGIDVIEDSAEELLGTRGDLRGVRLRSGQMVDCQRLFFTVAHTPASDLPDQLGCARTDEGCLEVDRDGLTTVPGVYAAGDITPGMQLVQVAAGKGTAAGVACAMSLADLDVPS